MSIRINREKCVGCRKCVEACPGNLISVDMVGKARIQRPEECWGCASCLKECRFKAISYFLGADIGGQGAVMQVERDGDFSKWIIRRHGKEPLIITVDRMNANRY